MMAASARRRALSGAAAVLVVLLAGCAGVTGIPTEAPRVSLADIGVEEIGVFEQKLRIVLRIQNPNDIAVDVDGLSLELDLNDRPLARGLRNESLQLQRFGDVKVAVDSVTNISNMLLQLRELHGGRRDRIDYRLRGRLNLRRGGSVPFDERGEIPLQLLLGDKQIERR